MAIITCSDCQKEYSDFSESCPKCGSPNPNFNKSKSSVFSKKVLIIIGVILFLSGVIFVSFKDAFSDYLYDLKKKSIVDNWNGRYTGGTLNNSDFDMEIKISTNGVCRFETIYQDETYERMCTFSFNDNELIFFNEYVRLSYTKNGDELFEYDTEKDYLRNTLTKVK